MLPFHRRLVSFGIPLRLFLLALLLATGFFLGTAPALADDPTTVTYTYDDAGRLIGVDHGDGKTITYTYDDAGNLLQHCTLTVDFDPDGQVNVADAMQVASRWRMTSADPDWEARYDLNDDGIITVLDIMLVVVHWGETCG